MVCIYSCNAMQTRWAEMFLYSNVLAKCIVCNNDLCPTVTCNFKVPFYFRMMTKNKDFGVTYVSIGWYEQWRLLWLFLSSSHLLPCPNSCTLKRSSTGLFLSQSISWRTTFSPNMIPSTENQIPMVRYCLYMYTSVWSKITVSHM